MSCLCRVDVNFAITQTKKFLELFFFLLVAPMVPTPTTLSLSMRARSTRPFSDFFGAGVSAEYISQSRARRIYQDQVTPRTSRCTDLILKATIDRQNNIKFNQFARYIRSLISI